MLRTFLEVSVAERVDENNGGRIARSPATTGGAAAVTGGGATDSGGGVAGGGGPTAASRGSTGAGGMKLTAGAGAGDLVPGDAETPSGAPATG